VSEELKSNVPQVKPVAALLTTPQAVKPAVAAPIAPKVSPFVAKYGSRTQTTTEISSPWLRALLHGEIDSWKTTTAAHFGTPEQTRIILTRGVDQLIPIINEGYKFLQAKNGSEFTEMMAFCDQIWPDWAKHPEPVLVIDDITRGKDFILDDSRTNDAGVEVKDIRKVYGIAMEAIDAAFTALNRKPIHVILTALTKVKDNAITREEVVTPDLPPAIGGFIMSDYSFIFFLDKMRPAATRMLTSSDRISYQEYDERQKQMVTYQRYFFARNKVPSEQAGQVLAQREPANLRAAWEKVKAARKVTK
jgi:hypothetical protein